MPYSPPPDIAALPIAEIARLAAERKLPPVSEWSPAHESDSRMRIAADGRWFHDGGEITRPAMVRAFSTLLRREGERFALVTPVEKQWIEVDDAPFIAVEMVVEGSGETARLAFRLNTDDLVVAGPDYAIIVRVRADDAIPYLHVRDGLEARLARTVAYDLFERAIDEGAVPPALWSDGARFVLEPI